MKKKRKGAKIGIGITVVAGVIVGGLLYFNRSSPSSGPISPSPTMPSTALVPSEAPTLDSAPGPLLYQGTNDSEKYCVYDLTGDGRVDTADLLEVFAQWGSSGPQADFNGDGKVDTRDYLSFNAHWGDCPEPSLGVGHPRRITGLWFNCIWCRTEEQVIDRYQLIRSQTYINAQKPVQVINHPNDPMPSWTFEAWSTWDEKMWLAHLDMRDAVIAADNDPDG